MAIPDISDLDRGELNALIREAQEKLSQAEVNEQDVREVLADPEKIRQTIDVLKAQAVNMQTVLDTPNSEIKSNPQQHIVSIARAVKRTINADIRSLKLAAQVFDDASTGDET